jgi:hypothetical protein
VLNCQHHISWVREVAGGLHQCMLCTAVVTKKDVYPKLEDLPEEFQRRWDAHEATRAEKPTATPTATATAPSPQPSPPARAGGEGAHDGEEEAPTARPPIPRGPTPRIPAPPSSPADPRTGG